MSDNPSRRFFISENGTTVEISEEDLRELLCCPPPAPDPVSKRASLTNLLQVNQRQWDIALFLQDHPSATAEDVQKHVGASIATVNRDLKKLKDAGFLIRVGSKNDMSRTLNEPLLHVVSS